MLGNKTEAHVRSFFVNYRRRYNLDEALSRYEKDHGIPSEKKRKTENSDENGVDSTEKLEKVRKFGPVKVNKVINFKNFFFAKVNNLSRSKVEIKFILSDFLLKQNQCNKCSG